METNFLEYFYHDVQVKSINFDFWQKDGTNKIVFLLSELDDNDEIEIDNKCIFIDVFDSSLSLIHNIIGCVYIMEAKIDNNDEYFKNYINKRKFFLSEEILDSLKCYIVVTTNGVVKIISLKDVEIVKC